MTKLKCCMSTTREGIILKIKSKSDHADKLKIVLQHQIKNI